MSVLEDNPVDAEPTAIALQRLVWQESDLRDEGFLLRSRMARHQRPGRLRFGLDRRNLDAPLSRAADRRLWAIPTAAP